MQAKAAAWFIGAVATLACDAVNASKCFSVGQLSGVASHRGNAFKVDGDGFAKQTFQVLVNGKMSIAPEWDTPCNETAPSTVICAKNEGGATTVELWAVDETTKSVLFTRIRSGFGIFDGAMLFSGRVLGTCGLTPPK